MANFLQKLSKKLGVLSYQGTWNASTNTPSLASGVGVKGYYYVVSTAGTTSLNGISSWDEGDWAIYNGTAWQRVDNANQSTNIKVKQQLESKVLVTTPAFTTATTSGSLTLNNLSASVQFITGVAANFTVYLPDATTLTLGTNYEIYNRSSSPVTIRHHDNTFLGTLAPESVSSLVLQSNSTPAGVFSPFTVEIAQAAGIANVQASSDVAFTTSSTTDVPVTGMTLTPPSGLYYFSFSSYNSSTQNNSLSSVTAYKNGTPISATLRTAQSTASNFVFLLQTQGVVSLNGVDEISIRAKVTLGSLTISGRNIILLRLGGATA